MSDAGWPSGCSALACEEDLWGVFRSGGLSTFFCRELLSYIEYVIYFSINNLFS